MWIPRHWRTTCVHPKPVFSHGLYNQSLNDRRRLSGHSMCVIDFYQPIQTSREVSASGMAWVAAWPWPVSTSICRNSAMICYGENVFLGISHSCVLGSIFSHASWIRKCRSGHIGDHESTERPACTDVGTVPAGPHLIEYAYTKPRFCDQGYAG